MSFEELNTLDVEYILCLLSNYDVCTFADAFPFHKESVDALWTRRPEVNVDNVLPRDASKMLHVIQNHGHLKKVTFKRCRPREFFNNFSAAIACNCSKLEVLDIPGFMLDEKDVNLLGFCFKLKQLNINYNIPATAFVPQLLANNPLLEDVSLLGIQVTNKCFQNLPYTIKRLEIQAIDYSSSSFKSFWERLQICEFEKLHISTVLRERHILRLSTQTSLKYLYVNLAGTINSLEVLFRNNPQLEEVHLDSIHAQEDDSCLQYLPSSLKCLSLTPAWRLHLDNFVNYTRTWKLESLMISCTFFHSINTLIKVLEAAPSLCEVHTGCSLLPDHYFTNLELLLQINTLSLSLVFPEYNDSLKSFLQCCVNLENLVIETRIDDDSEIFSVIENLPKLKMFGLHNEEDTSLNFDKIVLELSKSKSLISVNFMKCSLSLTSLLMAIRDCKTLTKLTLCEIHGSFAINEEFSKSIVEELQQQTERTEILTIEIELSEDDYKYIETLDLHPMLNLEIRSN